MCVGVHVSVYKCREGQVAKSNRHNTDGPQLQPGHFRASKLAQKATPQIEEATPHIFKSQVRGWERHAGTLAKKETPTKKRQPPTS